MDSGGDNAALFDRSTSAQGSESCSACKKREGSWIGDGLNNLVSVVSRTNSSDDCRVANCKTVRGCGCDRRKAGSNRPAGSLGGKRGNRIRILKDASGGCGSGSVRASSIEVSVVPTSGNPGHCNQSSSGAV